MDLEKRILDLERKVGTIETKLNKWSETKVSIKINIPNTDSNYLVKKCCQMLKTIDIPVGS